VTTELLDLWQEGAFELVVCLQLLDEVRQTLLHPRVAGRYGLETDEVDALVDRLREDGIAFDDPVDPPRVVPGDPNDDYLIALALSSGVEFFVTRDRHFDKVRIEGVKIRTPGRLLRELVAD
jgi:predicted nucleic acid-binding protein